MKSPLDSKPEYSGKTHLSDLAVTQPGASRVFHRHGLDFCCHGHVPLEDACRKAGLDPMALIEELKQEERLPSKPFERWDKEPLNNLVEHILQNFHEPHREELPRLIAMARKVESVHEDKADCPKGLGAHLAYMAEELESHMQKEEQVLFPLILEGRGQMAGAPIQAMEDEHKDHGKNLDRLRELAHGYQAPEEACGTWQALYLGLAEFEQDIMEHISLENNALFPRSLRS